ncbi:MAG TPA: hypothetical protein VGL82_15280 [Bryobacteraceae bacterium]
MKRWLLLLLPVVFLVQPNLAQQPTDKGNAGAYFVMGDVKRPGIYAF